MRKRRLFSLTAVVVTTALIVVAGRYDLMPLKPSTDLPHYAPRHVNPLRPRAPRPQLAAHALPPGACTS